MSNTKKPTHEEILEMAIQKAIDGGWDFFGLLAKDKGDSIWFESPLYNYWDVRRGQVLYNSSIPKVGGHTNIIFNHDFAKALWGEGHDCNTGYHKKREYFTMPATGDQIHEVNIDYVAYCLDHKENWQYHLQQMVIADDPIEYLGENI